MGKEIGYCNVCGDRITGSEFEKGKAVTVLRRNFCCKCSAQVVKDASEGGAYDPSRTPPPVRIQTRRVPLADKPGIVSIHTWLIVGTVVAILCMVMLILLMRRP